MASSNLAVLALVGALVCVCSAQSRTSPLDTTSTNFDKCNFVRESLANQDKNATCQGNPLYGLALVRAQPANDLDKLLVQELAYKFTCRQLAAGDECMTNPMCTTVVNTCDYVITTSSPTSRSQQAVMVYSKTQEITSCNFSATAEKFCVYNPYCVWTEPKDSIDGFASCTSRFGATADFPRYLAYTALGSNLATTLLDLFATCLTIKPTLDNSTNYGDCRMGGAFKIALDDEQIAALQKLSWAAGSGTGPTIRVRSPPPLPAPPLTEDDIYGTVTYYPPGKGPSSLLSPSGSKSSAGAAAASGLYGMLALVLALAAALVLAA